MRAHVGRIITVFQNEVIFAILFVPTRRGRGILVAPGFCPASGFLVGAKTKKVLVNFF